jgi:hypothetical protein
MGHAVQKVIAAANTVGVVGLLNIVKTSLRHRLAELLVAMEM